MHMTLYKIIIVHRSTLCCLKLTVRFSLGVCLGLKPFGLGLRLEALESSLVLTVWVWNPSLIKIIFCERKTTNRLSHSDKPTPLFRELMKSQLQVESWLYYCHVTSSRFGSKSSTSSRFLFQDAWKPNQSHSLV